MVKKLPKKKYLVAGVLISTLIIIITIAILLFFFTTQALFSKNSHFVLKKINVNSEGWWNNRTTRVAGTLGLDIGKTNIFDFQLADIKTRLETEPSIEKVEVSRTIPDTLNFKIIERIPRACLLKKDSLWVVDSKGFIMSRDSCLNLDGDLPIIMGFKLNDVTAGASLPIISSALELLMACKTDFPKFIISKVSVVKPEELIFTLHYEEKKGSPYIVYIPRTDIRHMLVILQNAIVSAKKNHDPRKMITLKYDGMVIMGPK